LPFSPEMHVLEIGPGCGFTAFRLAQQVRTMTLADVAAESLAQVCAELRHLPNVKCVSVDVTRPGLANKIQEDFDAAFGLDVFEYLPDPAVALKNLAEVLRPGGELLLTFPNVPPPEGDGVTLFTHLSEIEKLLAQARFREWQIFTVRLRLFAAAMYCVFHEWPLCLYRRLRHSQTAARPQTYEATWAFQHRRQPLALKIPLDLYWAALQGAMRLTGDAFMAEPATGQILGRQLVIRATR